MDSHVAFYLSLYSRVSPQLPTNICFDLPVQPQLTAAIRGGVIGRPNAIDSKRNTYRRFSFSTPPRVPHGAQGPVISKVFCAPARDGSSLRPRSSAPYRPQRRASERAVSGSSARRILILCGSSKRSRCARSSKSLTARLGQSQPFQFAAPATSSSESRLSRISPSPEEESFPFTGAAPFAGAAATSLVSRIPFPTPVVAAKFALDENYRARARCVAQRQEHARVSFSRCLRAPAQKGLPTPELIRPPCARVRRRRDGGCCAGPSTGVPWWTRAGGPRARLLTIRKGKSRDERKA